MPITSKDARLGRVHVRHQDVENSARLQPFADASHYPSRLVEMLEHVETGDCVKGFGREGRIRNISYKNLSLGPLFSRSRTIGGHLDSIKLPGLAPHELQERPRAAPEVEQCSGLLVLGQCSFTVFPAIRRVLARSRNQFVIRIRVMQIHFYGLGRMAEPDERTRRAAHQRVLLLPAVEAVRCPQPLLRARLPANRARLRTVILGPSPVLAVRNPVRLWNGS